jgi:hypothetical protein
LFSQELSNEDVAMMRCLIRRISFAGTIAGLTLSLSTGLSGQITTPMEAFGFNIGDDYHLANYTQLEAYWKTLDGESDRMILEEIGKTEQGRSQWMAIITSPENHRNLDRYREISRRLALAEDLTDEQARALAAEGKAVIWIDGGLHATEVLGAHQLMDFVYNMVSADDAETMRFLNDAIILAVQVNPDGQELVSDWYMRNENPTERSASGIPVLYQEYTGHDNNRDFFMLTQSESINIARIQYREWFPQIIYNHHQTGPAGTVMFAPPFRDPFNYNYDPLIPLSIEAVGTAMHTRLVGEGKGGSTMRSGASYSTWWNGGLRTTPYFHNMIGLLTETIGHPTPVQIPFIPEQQLPRNDLPLPIDPGIWHFKQSIDYSLTANKAVLNYASRNREDMLFNIYQMGRNAIARGNKDTWTMHPKLIAAAEAAGGQQNNEANQGRRRRGLPTETFHEVLRNPEVRDPRGYILSADQADFPTVTKFMNVLIKGGVTVHQATAGFSVDGKRYPAGSYVVKTAQAFAPHVFDMFEPQDHPNDFEYPGGPPISPYDNTGWTVALQMGVDFDRILEGFDGPFQPMTDVLDPQAGMVADAGGAQGFLMSHAYNDGFTVTNRLIGQGEAVFWLTDEVSAGGKTWPAGTVYIPATNDSRREVTRAASELGVSFQGVTSRPNSASMEIRPVRVGLWDRYGGSMPSGWGRFILDQFEFPYEVIYAPRLNAGDLIDDFDVIVFVSGAIPSGNGGGRGGFGGQVDESSIPSEFQGRMGSVTVGETVPEIRAFLEAGGSVVTIGTSTSLGNHLGLNLGNHVVDENGTQLGRDDFFIPGSILEMKIDNTLPVAYGMPDRVNVHFNNSPVYDVPEDAVGVRAFGHFDSATPLLSGWAWGQEVLDGGTTMLEAKVGNGTLYMFAPEVTRRAQPHATFKFLFNGIQLGKARAVMIP